MKRRIMKIFVPLVLLGILIFSTVFASGCYVVSGVKMKDLVGTYEMTLYTAKTNRMEENEIKMYVVFNSNGNGYYVYQDKDTELYAAELRCRFTANEENSSKYDYVEFEFTNRNDWTKFGVNKKNLNHNRIVWKPLEWGKAPEKNYDINVDFTKVSSKTDLSFVEKELKADLSAMAYGLSNVGGVYEFSGITYNDVYLTGEELATYGVEEPVYSYMRLDVFKNKVTVYYMYASNEVKEEFEENIVITGGNGTYTIMPDNIFVTSSGTIIGTMILTVSQYSQQITQSYEVKDADGNNVTLKTVMNYCAPVDYDLTETIANQVAAYEEQKGTTAA